MKKFEVYAVLPDGSAIYGRLDSVLSSDPAGMTDMIVQGTRYILPTSKVSLVELEPLEMLDNPLAGGLRRCIAEVVFRSSEGKWEKKEVTGRFHCWGTAYEEFDNGAVPVTTAIIEDETGKVWNTAAENVRFVQRRRR